MKNKAWKRVGVALSAAGLTIFAVSILSTGTSQAEPLGKVFVCKYVGTPGDDERLQTGNNPIDVSINAINDFQGVGSYFNDAQGRSFVLALDEGQAEPDVSSCPGFVPEPSPSPTVTHTSPAPSPTDTSNNPEPTETTPEPSPSTTTTSPEPSETETSESPQPSETETTTPAPTETVPTTPEPTPTTTTPSDSASPSLHTVSLSVTPTPTDTTTSASPSVVLNSVTPSVTPPATSSSTTSPAPTKHVSTSASSSHNIGTATSISQPPTSPVAGTPTITKVPTGTGGLLAYTGAPSKSLLALGIGLILAGAFTFLFGFRISRKH